MLAKYGIPPRPNAKNLPVLAEFWTEMFSPPLVFTEAKFLSLCRSGARSAINFG